MTSLAILTVAHVVVSLVGIGTGLVVMAGLLRSAPMAGWTLAFLVATVLTSASGFLFPFERLLPSHAVGAMSLVVLVIAIVARYDHHMEGAARSTYVIAASVALYLNVFVLMVQCFLKVPALHLLARNGSEPPFVIAQGIVLVLFVVFTVKAVRRFQPTLPR